MHQLVTLALAFLLLTSCRGGTGKAFPVDNDTLWHSMDKAALKQLLRDGYDINAPAYDGQPPLHLALNGGLTLYNPAVAELLMEHRKCDVRRTDEQGMTAFLSGLSYLPSIAVPVDGKRGAAPEWEEHDRLLRLLVKRGAKVRATAADGTNALHIALWSNVPAETVQWLITEGVDPNGVDNEGFTPLFYGSNTVAHAALIAAGADVNAGAASGGSPLMGTAAGVGQTPLHMALGNNFNGEKAAFLLSNGANPALVDGTGKSPLDYALYWRDHYREAAAQRSKPSSYRLSSRHSMDNWVAEQLAAAEAVVALLAPDGVMPEDYRDPRPVGLWQSEMAGEQFVRFDSSGGFESLGDGRTGLWHLRGDSLRIIAAGDTLAHRFVRVGDTSTLNGMNRGILTKEQPLYAGSALGSLVQYCFGWNDAPIEQNVGLTAGETSDTTTIENWWSDPVSRYRSVSFQAGESAEDSTVRVGSTTVGHWQGNRTAGELRITDKRGVLYSVEYTIIDGMLWLFDDHYAFGLIENARY